jgi:glycosyltransferase involved in cell wall biosynthesis
LPELKSAEAGCNLRISGIRGKAVIAGCARNCATHLPAVLDNIGRAARLFTDVAVILVENDSTDETPRILKEFRYRGKPAEILHAPGLAAALPRRTERLAHARNLYLDRISHSGLSGYDYLLVADLDDVNAEPWDEAALQRAVDFLESNPDHAGAFANQPALYYDMWALRHPELCPGDIWEQVLGCALNDGISDAAAFQATFARRMFRIPEHASAVEVDSAFGGLGIYRLPMARGRRYAGGRRFTLAARQQTITLDGQVCEHVSFNAGVRSQGGRLFILPWLVNNRKAPPAFNPSFVRSLFRPCGAVGAPQ